MADRDLIVLLAAAAANGSSVETDVLGYRGGTLEVGGTFTATVTFEGRVDSAFYAVPLQKSDGTFASSTTAAGLFHFPSGLPALAAFRVTVSGYSAGAVGAKLRKTFK